MLAAAGPENDRPGATSSEPVAVSAGTQVGQYRIESLIGHGGMGMVYQALDTKLNRPVAVKFLFDHLADPAARRRFQREAQTASSLNHPHILTVYDAGDFNGRQYLVTEFIDGGTLRDWTRAEKRTWREIVALLLGVADGLAAAHSAGILHCDIKPDNILVGRNGYAKLSDFGLAKLQDNLPPDKLARTLSTRTAPGMIMGTIAYMSPEQASGLPTDPRSDIFSFGVVLYELLAGRRPFEGATDLAVLQAIIHGNPTPLSPDLPYPLRIVVERRSRKPPPTATNPLATSSSTCAASPVRAENQPHRQLRRPPRPYSQKHRPDGNPACVPRSSFRCCYSPACFCGGSIGPPRSLLAKLCNLISLLRRVPSLRRRSAGNPSPSPPMANVSLLVLLAQPGQISGYATSPRRKCILCPVQMGYGPSSGRRIATLCHRLCPGHASDRRCISKAEAKPPQSRRDSHDPVPATNARDRWAPRLRAWRSTGYRIRAILDYRAAHQFNAGI